MTASSSVVMEAAPAKPEVKPAAAGCGSRRPRAETDVLSRPANSLRLSIINWLSIASLYIPYVLAAGVAFAVASLMPRTVDGAAGLQHMMDTGRTVVGHVTSVWYAYAILCVAIYWLLSVKPSVYLVDYAVFTPPENWKVSRADIVNIMGRLGHFDQSALDFMARMLERSGTGEATHWPPATVRMIRPEVGPRDAEGNLLPFDGPDTSIDAAREVTQTVMFGCMEELMRSTGLRGKDVDFLIVNCSLFCPTPSLASMVVQRFGLRQDIRSYNLGGMGCSAGLISIDLAKQLLENRPGSIAVVISLEDITQQMYTGSKRSMLLQNTLFRVGGAAIMLSNKPMDGFRAKYKLLHTVRVQDTSPAATGAVVQTEDETGKRGIELSKDLMNVAAKVLRDNLTLLGPHVLPVREQVKVVASLFARKAAAFLNAWADKSGVKHLPFAPRTVPAPPQPVDAAPAAAAAAPPAPVVFCGVPATGGAGAAAVAPAADAAATPAPSTTPTAAAAAPTTTTTGTGKPSRDAPRAGRYPKPDVYVPDFKQGIHHFCIHAGGRAVIDGIEQALKLSPRDTAPSRQTLLQWGNTSSSSIWYELKFAEGEDKRFALPDEIGPSTVRRGERVLQIGFGSGFKCNSAVWLRMK